MSFDANDQLLIAQYIASDGTIPCAVASLAALYGDRFPDGATQVDMGPADDVHEIHKKAGISLDLFKQLVSDALTRLVQSAVVELSSGDESSPVVRRRTMPKERTPPARVPPRRLRRRARTVKSESSSSEEAEESEESDSVDEHGNLRGFVEQDDSDESERDESEDELEGDSEGEDEGQSGTEDAEQDPEPEPVDTSEVEVTGERTREERDTVLLASAVDLIN